MKLFSLSIIHCNIVFAMNMDPCAPTYVKGFGTFSEILGLFIASIGFLVLVVDLIRIIRTGGTISIRAFLRNEMPRCMMGVAIVAAGAGMEFVGEGFFDLSSALK